MKDKNTTAIKKKKPMTAYPESLTLGTGIPINLSPAKKNFPMLQKNQSIKSIWLSFQIKLLTTLLFQKYLPRTT